MRLWILSAQARPVDIGSYGVFRLMSQVLSVPDTTAAALYEEIKRCGTAVDIDNARLSKAVLLQQEALLLKDASIIDTSFEGYWYQPEQDAEGGDAPALSVCPCTTHRFLRAVPGWFALDVLEGEVMQCLSLVFQDIATSACLAGLNTPQSVLQGDTPSAKMLEACMVCTGGNAKPATGAEERRRRWRLARWSPTPPKNARAPPPSQRLSAAPHRARCGAPSPDGYAPGAF